MPRKRSRVESLRHIRAGFLSCDHRDLLLSCSESDSPSPFVGSLFEPTVEDVNKFPLPHQSVTEHVALTPGLCFYSLFPFTLSCSAEGRTNSMDRRKLEDELAGAVAREKERKDVDDMKKRAITSAKTYDDFKNMVACASLKPLSRGDFSSKAAVSSNKAVHAAVPGRDFGDTGVSDATAAALAAAARAKAARAGAGSTPVRNAGEFDREWRRLPKDAGSRFKFLRDLGPDKIAHVFRSEIDSLLLSDIIATAAAACARGSDVGSAASSAGGGCPAASVAEDAARILVAISRGSLFNLAAGFLTKTDRDAVSAIAVAMAPAAVADGSVAADGAGSGVDGPSELHRQLLAAYGLPAA